MSKTICKINNVECSECTPVCGNRFNELIADPVKDKEFIEKLNSNKDKVKFLRGKKYTQEEVASIIGINVRTVQRIEKNLREL